MLLNVMIDDLFVALSFVLFILDHKTGAEKMNLRFQCFFFSAAYDTIK